MRQLIRLYGIFGTCYINGGTVTASNGATTIGVVSGGEFTMSSGIVNASNKNAIYIQSGATATIRGDAETTKILSSATGYPTVYNVGELQINGGTIDSKNNISVQTVSGGNTVITGGRITADGEPMKILSGGSTTISGAVEIISNGSKTTPAVYNYGKLDITGGTITHLNGGVGVFNSGGQVTITGGNISSTEGC